MYLHDYMNYSATTWLADQIIAQIIRCLGLPDKVYVHYTNFLYTNVSNSEVSDRGNNGNDTNDELWIVID